VAPSVAHAVRRRASTWTYPPVLVEGEGPRLDVMRAATVALACSGTVSTELAVAGCPMVIAYRLGGLSYLLIRSMIKTRFITLLNVAAGRAVAPELIQKRCIGPNLARELAARLDDPRLRAQQIADQTAALALMGEQGGPDPSERAADAVIDLLKSRGAL
jgi:lipid-A-disaccharide synthase